MQPVLVITAVRQEGHLLEQALAGTVRSKKVIFPYLSGTIGTVPVALCTAGVGKINAAAATTLLIERLQPSLVINTGCAGAFPGSGLDVGGLAVASSECIDEGVITSAGWLGLREINVPTVVMGSRRYYNEISLSQHPAERAMQLADHLGVPLVRGKFLTVSVCSGSSQQAASHASRFGAICENMEGAAVAQICLRYGIDCMEIRGISNLVEERNMAAWDIPRAVEAAQRFVLKYLEEISRPDPQAEITPVAVDP